ncbi:hypothetical protein SpCBS45565_g06590 [Spizellomyces sp. 'palustris']|nr:hypothetical protein SpCBS45565_g08113 [Spizellomyces sp. 'palustris']TPX63467.1 hypothetical protein SpCBS45565_g06590 [Spizellomyces sp. 'palustris']
MRFLRPVFFAVSQTPTGQLPSFSRQCFSNRFISSSRVCGARKNHYQVLNVPQHADKRALKAQFYKLSMRYHPDKNPGDEDASAKFIEINEAYSTLNDDFKRQEYDRTMEVLDSKASPFNHNRTGPRRTVRPYESRDHIRPDDWILYRRSQRSSRPIYDFGKHEQEHYGRAAEKREHTRQARLFKTLYFRKLQEAEKMESRMMYVCALVGFGVFFLFQSGLIQLIFLDDDGLDENLADIYRIREAMDRNREKD